MKKYIRFILGIFVFTLICSTHGSKAQAATSEMKIHVIHLTTKSGATLWHGDAVLLTSNGKNLLMDTGSKSSSASLIRYLKKKNIKNLNIYISHVHDDHYGGLQSILSDKYFNVSKVYLPYRYGSSNADVKKEFQSVKQIVNTKKIPITYLKTGSAFTVGYAKIKIMGSIGSYSPTKTEFHMFKNNYSLCAMITCGKTKYLTTGDITASEEKVMVNKYGSALKADIMKVSHHGSEDASSSLWLKTVKPKYAFAVNNAVIDTVKKRITKYANYKVTGVAKKTIIYTIKNNKISVSYY